MPVAWEEHIWDLLMMQKAPSRGSQGEQSSCSELLSWKMRGEIKSANAPENFERVKASLFLSANHWSGAACLTLWDNAFPRWNPNIMGIWGWDRLWKTAPALSSYSPFGLGFGVWSRAAFSCPEQAAKGCGSRIQGCRDVGCRDALHCAPMPLGGAWNRRLQERKATACVLPRQAAR